MDEKRDGLESLRLDEDEARRLIARATELDARLATQSSIADLREAARGAGISDEAFQRALAEVRPEQPPVAGPDALFDINRRQPWRRVAVALVVGLLVALLVTMRLIPVAVHQHDAGPTPQAGAPALPPPPR